jgi:hypothetical protein
MGAAWAAWEPLTQREVRPCGKTPPDDLQGWCSRNPIRKTAKSFLGVPCRAAAADWTRLWQAPVVFPHWAGMDQAR